MLVSMLGVALLAVGAIGKSPVRQSSMNPEDPGVLRWLEAVQDHSSTDRKLLPSMEDNQVCTFNNALAAMAFLLSDRRERAERILGFFAGAIEPGNQDKTLQSFYVGDEARGFWQYVNLRTVGGVAAYHAAGGDRWMGDMAWLLLACKFYEKRVGSDRYAKLEGRLRELLISYYKDAGNGQGYVQHGWRKGDTKLHEADGHHEGNIDCYAVFRLTRDQRYAEGIRKWLAAQLDSAKDLPLDLYTWRVMAEGPASKALLSIPEGDPRIHKSLRVKGKPVQGFFHGFVPDVQNFWIDGTGHMACAYWAVDNTERAAFYANQLDLLLIPRTIGGISCKALPYTANKTGGYDWVRPDKGALSAAAWYIFAKRGFNPLRLEIHKP